MKRSGKRSIQSTDEIKRDGMGVLADPKKIRGNVPKANPPTGDRGFRRTPARCGCSKTRKKKKIFWEQGPPFILERNAGIGPGHSPQGHSNVFSIRGKPRKIEQMISSDWLAQGRDL